MTCLKDVERCPNCNDSFSCDELLTCHERAVWWDKAQQVSRAHDDIARLQNEQRALLGPVVSKALQTWKWKLYLGYDATSFEPIDRDLGRELAHRLAVDFDLGAFIERQRQEKLKSIDDEIAYLQKQRATIAEGKGEMS